MTDNLARQPQFKVIVGRTQPLSPQNKQQTVIEAEIAPELANVQRPDQALNTRRLFIHPDTARWITSAALVFLAYTAPIIWWLIPDNTPGTVAPPPAAMIIELAPLPVAPPSPPDMPPGPEQAEVTPPPKPEPIPEPEPEIPPAPLATKPEVAVAPEPETESKEKPLPEEPPLSEPPPLEKAPEEVPPEEKPISAASAPPEALQEADQAAAPNLGVSSPAVNVQRKLTWQNALMLKLNESKQYPSLARRYRQEGVVYLRFTMDKDGNVLAKNIEQSAGHPLLDEEALELIERAQPLPTPPVEMDGDSLEFVVPVEFFLRR